MNITQYHLFIFLQLPQIWNTSSFFVFKRLRVALGVYLITQPFNLMSPEASYGPIVLWNTVLSRID